jgi:phosphatidylserine/phosphatidylglycerophosphate/cardiolipin synthase-like enzyme
MRDLLTAIKRFIQKAKPGDTLLGCFYEFHYKPVLEELKAAIDREVDVQLIIDAKVNETTDKKGVFHESFPREENLRTIKKVGIPIKKHVTQRQARPANIQHNKFMVLVRGGKAREVWTGSTNISEGGFSGQTNVGHWVREPGVAKQFKAYWELLKSDPGAVRGLERSETLKLNRLLHEGVGKLHETPAEFDQIPEGTTAVFSPRAGSAVLDMYVKLCDTAKACSCITLAFGINESFKKALLDNSDRNHLVFMLLEKRDEANPRGKTPFVPLTAVQNVSQAWGAFIKDPIYQWAQETNASLLGMNKHVTYVHSKFLLMDPLGEDPLVITGSANFSKASTNDNDENMLIIRGDQRVADIYFTEFNRLFNHYYFRSVTEATKGNGHKGGGRQPLPLRERGRLAEEVRARQAEDEAPATLHTDGGGRNALAPARKRGHGSAVSHFLTFVFADRGEADVAGRVRELMRLYFAPDGVYASGAKCDGYVIGGATTGSCTGRSRSRT